MAILAGGLATRLGAVTATTPKSLVPVAGQPFIVQQLRHLRRQNLTDVVLLVGHLGHQIEAVVGTGKAWGVNVRYAYDGPRALGTGGALKQALHLLGDPFFVMYGDSYLDCDFQAIARIFLPSEALGLMTVFANQGRWDRSNVEFRAGRIIRYDKQQPTPAMQHIDYGLGVCRHAAFDQYPQGEPFDLSEVQRNLLHRDALVGVEVSRRFYEIGSPAGLAETDAYLTARVHTL